MSFISTSLKYINEEYFIAEKTVKELSYAIPTSVKDVFLDDIHLRAKFTIFKSGSKESYEVEKTNFLLEKSESCPDIFSNVFTFSIDFIKIESNHKELINMIRNNDGVLENGWCKLSVRKILEFKNLPDTIALEVLKPGVDVLIRSKFNNAINKLNNRKIH